MFKRRKHASHRLLGEFTDFKPIYSIRTKLLLALISLAMSLAMWYHVRTDNSSTRAIIDIHERLIEEELDVCDMPGPCWGENPPVDCECY